MELESELVRAISAGTGVMVLHLNTDEDIMYCNGLYAFADLHLRHPNLMLLVLRLSTKSCCIVRCLDLSTNTLFKLNSAGNVRHRQSFIEHRHNLFRGRCEIWWFKFWAFVRSNQEDQVTHPDLGKMQSAPILRQDIFVVHAGTQKCLHYSSNASIALRMWIGKSHRSVWLKSSRYISCRGPGISKLGRSNFV